MSGSNDTPANFALGSHWGCGNRRASRHDFRLLHGEGSNAGRVKRREWLRGRYGAREGMEEKEKRPWRLGVMLFEKRRLQGRKAMRKYMAKKRAKLQAEGSTYDRFLNERKFKVRYPLKTICAICGRDIVGYELCLDHDHTTGEFRGCLCRPCNLGLANFQESVLVLQAAIRYLENCQ